MTTVQIIFLVAALILFILASANVPQPRFNLIAAGLAFVVAAMLSPLFS